MHKTLRLMLWVIVFELVGFALGTVSNADKDTWYQALNLSPLTPPGVTFSIVWGTLYIMLAFAGFTIFEKDDNAKAKMTYALQILLNWSWTPVFFALHIPWAGLIVILLVILFTLLTMLLERDDTLIIALFVPYLLWLLFAGYLNGYIWWYN